MGLVARASKAPSPYVVPPSQKFDGNDGSWSTFSISVGNPGQDFRVLPSTKSSVTVITVPDGCQAGKDPPNCPQLRGVNAFNSIQSIGFQANESKSWSAIGQFGLDMEQPLGLDPQAMFGFDKVALSTASFALSGNTLSLDRQIVGGVAELDYFLGLLPLGQIGSSFASLNQPIPPLLSQLRNNSLIPSFSYAYTAGAKYQQKSAFGSLILGGYDSTRFKPNDNPFSFTFSTDPSKLLTVGVESVMATDTLKGTYSLSSAHHFSVIDSTVPHLWLPASICSQFEQAFGLTYDPKTDLYLVNDTVHQQLLSKKPVVTIKLVNSMSATSTNYTNIQLPYAAFDLKASYPYYTNATNYFPIRRAANDSQYVLGRTLLQEAYLIVDYERANFTISPAVFPDPLPPANVVTITSAKGLKKTDSDSGLGTGAIVGIVIGCAIVLIVGIVGSFIWRRRKQGKQRFELDSNQVDAAPPNPPMSSYSPVPMKSQGPMELSGTPITELASPQLTELASPFLTELASPLDTQYPMDKKTAPSVNIAPAELHADSKTPITPRWEEVQVPPPTHRARDTDAESNLSRSVSQVPSDDGCGGPGVVPQSGVSPLTGMWGQQQSKRQR